MSNTEAKNETANLCDIKCPKCEKVLDSHLTENLQMSLKFEKDPASNQLKQVIKIEGNVECPGCKSPLNEFLLKSMDTNFEILAKSKPASQKGTAPEQPAENASVRNLIE